MAAHRLVSPRAAVTAVAAAPGTDRLDSLTGLRIFAAVWVMLLHFRTVTDTSTLVFPLVDQLVLAGNYGVDLFFVLSGFILSHVYFDVFGSRIDRGSYWSFISFRFARLYPVHLVTFLLMVGLFVGQIALAGRSSADAPERYGPWAVGRTLTMTQAWGGPSLTPNLPSWSISAEWFAYLLFPFLCLLIARSWLLVIGCAAVGVGLAVVGQTDYDLVRVMAGFLVGMAVFQISRRPLGLERFRFLGSLTVVVIVCWAVSGLSSRLEIGVVLFAVLVLAISSGRDWLCSILSLRFVVYLGEVSYALYMVHWVVRVVMRTVLQKAGVFAWAPLGAVLGLYIVVTVLAAVVLYHLVERPWRSRLRHWLTGRHKVALAGGVA